MAENHDTRIASVRQRPMVERVAVAIRVASLANQGIVAVDDVVLTPNERKAYLPLARAAIEALRKPTNAMENSGVDVALEHGCLMDESETNRIWEAYLDAALFGEGI